MSFVSVSLVTYAYVSLKICHCATVVAIDYVQFLVQHKKEQEEKLDKLRKDVMALKIMLALVLHLLKSARAVSLILSLDAQLCVVFLRVTYKHLLVLKIPFSCTV